MMNGSSVGSKGRLPDTSVHDDSSAWTVAAHSVALPLNSLVLQTGLGSYLQVNPGCRCYKL
jgi:hypothetical protein